MQCLLACIVCDQPLMQLRAGQLEATGVRYYVLGGASVCENCSGLRSKYDAFVALAAAERSQKNSP